MFAYKMLLTARSIILLLFGGLLLLRPISSVFLRAHLHPPGWGYTVLVSDNVDPEQFVVIGATFIEIGSRNQEFKEEFDRDSERATRQIESIGAFIARSNWLCVIAGGLLIFAALPLDILPSRRKEEANNKGCCEWVSDSEPIRLRP
jgi:hypothetical protein